MQCYPRAFGPWATLHNFRANFFSVDLGTSQYLYIVICVWLSQSILYWLPRLTLVADDERISPEMFGRYSVSWHSTHIPLRGTSDQLKNCTAGPWKLKHAGLVIVLYHHMLFQGSYWPGSSGIISWLWSWERGFFFLKQIPFGTYLTVPHPDCLLSCVLEITLK